MTSVHTVPESWLQSSGVMATSLDPSLLPLEGVLRLGPYEVPLFQRRYCWGEPEWAGLWDALAGLVADPDPSTGHSLRRLLVFSRPGRPALVLDGQQRLTSCTLLLAALRDAAAAAGLEVPAASLASLLDGALQPTLDDR